MALPPLPDSLKYLREYLKLAVEHDNRDPVVSYYCRLYAFQRGLELDKKSPEARALLSALMDLLETGKKSHADGEAMTNEVVGQAHVENHALHLFRYADNEDRAARFGMNVVKAYLTAVRLFDVLAQFGELSEDIEKIKKYAKFKATHIHSCLKNGETPHAGPLGDEEEGGYSLEGIPGLTLTPENLAMPGPSNVPPVQPQMPPQQPNPYHQPELPNIPPAQPNTYMPGAFPTSHVPPSQPYQAPPAAAPIPAAAASAPAATWEPLPNKGNIELTPHDYQRATKFCRFAISALQYEDSQTAMDNLVKCLNLLSTGKEP